jgi:hypothetical protein
MALQTRSDQDEISSSVKKCLFKELRAIHKGVPLGDLIRAIDQPEELSRIFATVEKGELVKDFFIEAVAAGGGTEEVLKRFLRDSLHNCVYDIPYMASTGGVVVSITVGRQQMREAEADLQPEIARIAAKLAANPDWEPKQAPVRRTPEAEDETSRMLGRSLLAGGLQ